MHYTDPFWQASTPLQNLPVHSLETPGGCFLHFIQNLAICRKVILVGTCLVTSDEEQQGGRVDF